MTKHQLRIRREAKELTWLMAGCLAMATLSAALLAILIKESL